MVRNSIIFIFLSAFLVFGSTCSLAQEKHYYFFHPYTYGSDALYNPVSLLASGGFDSFQILERQPTWNNVYWDVAATNVWRSITSPLPIISDFGWNRFLRQEVFPMSLNMDEAQWAPNFALHTLGGGMEYRKISEWYDYHDVPLPYAFGITTCIAYEFLNEVVENGPVTSPNQDCLSDMLIFQPLGFLLFSFDGIAEFCSSTLNMNDWSEPMGVSFAPFAIRNAGQSFVAKIALNHAHTTSVFFHFGEFAIVGLSLKTNNEDAISFGAGMASTGIKDLPVQNGVNSNTVTAGPMAGIYYDRNNSLLASLKYCDNQNTRFRLNVYPGLFSTSTFSPGFFLTVAHDGTTTAGLTMHLLPLGIGFFSPR
jgi:hypothetical protein